MKIRKTLAAFAAAGILGAVAISPAAHAASSLKTFSNTAAHYTLAYPSNWSASKVTGVDLFLTSPDSVAFISMNATKSHMTANQIHLAQQKAFLHFGTIQGKAKFVSFTLSGTSFQIAEIVTKTSSKGLVDIILADAVRGGYVYDFNGGYKTKLKSSDAESTQIINSLKSLTLK